LLDHRRAEVTDLTLNAIVPLLLASPGRGLEKEAGRAFGEIVAVPWSRSHNGATVQLERLWHAVFQKEAFSLFCAYPRCGFTRDASKSMQ